MTRGTGAKPVPRLRYERLSFWRRVIPKAFSYGEGAPQGRMRSSGSQSKVGIGLQDILYLGEGKSDEAAAIAKTDKLIIDGLAAENIHSLIGDKLRQGRLVRSIVNQYCFIDWSDRIQNSTTTKRIKKAIGVSAHGNIYPGCLMEYDQVDAKPMGNVLSDNILQAVENYCWVHPLTTKMNTARELCAAYDFLRSAGIEVPDFHGLDKCWIGLIDSFERQAVKLHEQYPNLAPWIIQLAAAISICHAVSNISGDNGQRNISKFVDLYFDPEFQPDLRAKLLTDAGRHELASQIDDIVAEEQVSKLSIQFAGRAKPKTYADARHEFVAQREREKWQRLHAEWAQQGRWDAIRATKHMID